MDNTVILSRLQAIRDEAIPFFAHPETKQLLIAHAGTAMHPNHKFYSMPYVMEKALLAGIDVRHIADRSSGSWAMAGSFTACAIGGKSSWVTVGPPSHYVRAYVEAKGGTFVEVRTNADRIAKLEAIVRDRDVWCPDQHNNPDVIEAFDNTLGAQIEREVYRHGLEPAFFVAPVGTGGSAAGIGRRLRRGWPNLRVVGADLSSSLTHSGARSWKPKQFCVRGVGSDDEVCGTLKLARAEIDELYTIDAFNAAKSMRSFFRASVGCGMSGGMALAVAFDRCLPRCAHGQHVIVLLPDSGYLYSNELANANVIYGSETSE